MRLGGESKRKSTSGRGTPYMPEQSSASEGGIGEGHEGFEFWVTNVAKLTYKPSS